LVSIVIVADWRNRVRVEGLGDAIVAAVSGNAFADFERGLEQAEDLVAQLGEAVASLPRGFSSGSTEGNGLFTDPGTDRFRPPSKVSVQQLNRLVESLFRTESKQSVSNLLSGAGPAGVNSCVGRSTNRRVEVTLVQELVTRIAIDTAWANRATVAQLSTSVLEAFTDAYAATDEAKETKSGEQAPSGTDALRSLLEELDELGIPVHPNQVDKDILAHDFPSRGDR
jgi:hypothetical protein